MKTFWLGTHQVNWLTSAHVPLFISRRRLVRRATLPRCSDVWALDSGAFSELLINGTWSVEPKQYSEEVARFANEIGNLAWAAIQDWMCEEFILKKTGLTLQEHQRRTTDNYSALLDSAPGLPWVPVLQGWTLEDYCKHVEMYERHRLPIRDRLVGLGSVCRRQATGLASAVVKHLRLSYGLRLHGFGIKTNGLDHMAEFLESADSMAWSYRGRRAGRHLDCSHVSGANCLKFALKWRETVLSKCDKRLRQEVLTFG